MQMAIAFVATLLAGLAIAVETPTNALLTKTSGSAIWAAFVSFVVGTVVLGAVLLAMRTRLQPGWIGQTPWYAFVGGVCGAVVVGASAWATPKLGAGTTLVVIVASQVALGVALDNFGVLGLEHHPAGWLRLTGVAVLTAGALMVSLG